MFALHETTQRRVCRVTFLLACVLPILATLAVVVYSNRPWQEADWQRTLDQSFHIRAQLDHYATPRPGVAEFTNLRLADLRTNHPLASVAKLRSCHQDNRLSLQAELIELEAEQLPALATTLATWLATDQIQPFELRVERLTIVSKSFQALPLQGLTIRSDGVSPKRQQFLAKAFDSEGNAVQLKLVADRVALQCRLVAQQSALPCWLVGKLVPGLRNFGEAMFTGQISAQSEDHGLHGKLSGNLAHVDLQTWFGERGPHRLEGQAQIQLRQFAWSDNGIKRIEGTMHAQQGAVNDSLLNGMSKLFGCNAGPAFQLFQEVTPESLLPFDQLAIQFRVDSNGIVLTGAGANDALLSNKGKTMLYGPQREQAFAVANLVQLFHRAQHGFFPDTRGSLDMATELPLPGDMRNSDGKLRK